MYDKNISQDRKKYLRKIKKEKIAVILTQISILLVFMIGWEILANQGIIDSFITSQPSRIITTFLNLSQNRTDAPLGNYSSRNLNRFLIRSYFRNYYCHFTMVV